MAPSGPAAAGRESQRRDRLLVVEDDPVTRAMIAGYFAEHNFSVLEAGSCAECRLMLKRHGADLVFVDVQLPDGDGFDLARDIQALEELVGNDLVRTRDVGVDPDAGKIEPRPVVAGD